LWVKGGFILRRLVLTAILLAVLLTGFPASASASGSEKESFSKWRLKINIPATTMYVYKDDILWKELSVAVGRIEKQTPVGKFHIVSKIKDPTWSPEGKPPVPPGPDNPLGSYWLGLNIPGYGIHGNNNPFSIGYWVSSGCIRVKNADIEVLFHNLSIGTPVEIVYEPVNLLRKEDRIWLDLYPDIYRLVPDLRQLVGETVKQRYPEFNLHEEGLWKVIGEHRPALLELPEAVDFFVDEEPQREKAFRWNDQIFLPAAVEGLWDSKSQGQQQEEYWNLWDFLTDYSGRVYGVWDEQSNSVQLTTVRLYFQGRPLPVRGWLREEPYLIWEQLVDVLSAMDIVAKQEPGQDPLTVEGESVVSLDGVGWIGLSGLQKAYPHLTLKWIEEDWRVDLSLKK